MKFTTKLRNGSTVTIFHDGFPIETLNFQETDEWQGFLFGQDEFDVHYLVDDGNVSVSIYPYKDGKTFTDDCVNV